MKKFLRVVSILFIAICTLTGCSKYKDEAGVYKCVEIKLNGQNMLSQYEYYNIELKSNGDCYIYVKAAGSSQKMESKCTFEIKGEKIYIYSKVDDIKVTEEYEYKDGLIIMDTNLEGIHVYAVFQRSTEDK